MKLIERLEKYAINSRYWKEYNYKKALGEEEFNRIADIVKLEACARTHRIRYGKS